MTEKPNSDITGDEYGSSHSWKNLGTGYSRTTLYECRACYIRFAHHYPSTPNIFKAMKDQGVTDKCLGGWK